PELQPLATITQNADAARLLLLCIAAAYAGSRGPSTAPLRATAIQAKMRRVKKPPALAQAMTPFPYAIETDRPLADARAMMDRHDSHHLPVTEGGELVGVISDRDVEIATAVTHDTDPSLTVAAVYSSHPYV